MITVAIIDQELTFADALAIRLGAESDIKVVAAVKARSGPVLGGYADVILLDADADLTYDTADLLRNADSRPQTRVVMLSHTSEPERIVAAIKAGAAAWIRKDESVQHVLEVLRGVARGQIWLPVAEADNVRSPLLCRQDSGSAEGLAAAGLTQREREVLDCLADGAGRSEVAARLHISVNTVRTHLQNIMRKLGVHSSLEAVAMVRRQAEPDSGLPEHAELAADSVELLHQRLIRTAHTLRFAAADTAALLEEQAELFGQPAPVDYPAMIKRWRIVADQARQLAERWEKRW